MFVREREVFCPDNSEVGFGISASVIVISVTLSFVAELQTDISQGRLSPQSITARIATNESINFRLNTLQI